MNKIDTQVLRDLVEGWRVTAREHRSKVEWCTRCESNKQVAEALEKCASELSAAIYKEESRERILQSLGVV